MSKFFLPLLLLICNFSIAQTTRGYFMHPDLKGDQLVFVAEGDIWRVPTSGGNAIRLTSHPGDESDPKISPDGKWVAYAASYEGPTEVYVMPIEGGLPKRLTFEPSSSIPTAWKSATEIAYVTNQYSTLPKLNTVTVNVSNGAKKLLPLEMAAEGSFSADGSTYFFVRPTFHNNVTKRYEGGTARQLWKYSDGAAEAVKLTKDYKGEDHHPVPHQGKVFFLSSRDGIVNVWSMDENGGSLTQITKEPSFDVREFSISGNQLVYRVGADLKLMDLGTASAKTLAIQLVSDFDQLREKWVDNPMSNLTNMAVSNDGERVVMTTRGRVFSVPVKDGRTVRLSRKDGVRYRDAIFSPDGKSILTFSDESSEFEIHEYNSLGMDQGKQISKNGTTLKFDMRPSPDGSKIAYRDLNETIWIMDKATGAQTKVTDSDESITSSMAWSPDGKWLAYAQAASNTFSQIHAFNIDSKKRIAMTSDRANSLSPQWSTDGNWLYFLSDRNFETVIGSPWGTRQPEPFWEKQMKIYQIGLKSGLVSPFFFNNELQKEAEKAPEKVTVTIEENGLQARLREVPVSAGNYTNLIVTDKAIYFHEIGPGMGVIYGAGASGDDKAPLMMVPISNKPEPKAFIDNVRNYTVSLNNKYILVRSGSNYSVVELGTSPVSDLSKTKVDFSGVTYSIDPREDWKQIYTDAWRMERDYFYDAGMHGVDWDAMYQKYLPLVDRVTTRAELSDVIGELVGELSVLHTSVRGGDLRDGEDNINFGMLGAKLGRNEKLKGYSIDHIYLSDPDYPNEMSPLAHPDLTISEGDIITHIDGVAVMEVPDLYYLLRDKAGKQVRISLLSADGKAKSDQILKPMSAQAESNLRYNEWEYTRRLETEAKSDGALGYVHLRAMTESDISQWYRDFYPQFKKEGLVIDMRQNRGGNIDSFILEKLMREVFFYWKGRTGEPYWNMPYAFRGHLVLLVDEFTASDGEAFAEGFRRLGMGKAIGGRTWGGEVWLSGSNTLSDNGIARAPMNGVYGEEGEWLIEGVGFIPDIEVINLPKATFEGKDAQLEAAIEHLKALIKADPRPVPQAPAYPDKSFKNGKN
ncbi:MAG: S41 family peptidase [Algoriphagus sp.]|uniref:S41 family peptidase n=1 Tax=Algoriphagus sp. TaxID=1872435 RepID=UPI00262C3D93|nr:S41 family peptidase [Algoriphagus sp.]MDG1277825.1 S41 family peptidase [Algoriphagus sp.]